MAEKKILLNNIPGVNEIALLQKECDVVEKEYLENKNETE